MDRDINIIKLYLDGVSAIQISKEFGVGKKTVYRILSKHNIPLHKDTKIKEIKKCVICEKPSSKTLCGTCQTNKRRYETKIKAVEYLGGECKKCSWKGDPSGFDFHHRDPNEKSFQANAQTITSMCWESAKLELDKCDLLCALCHRLEHSNYDKFKDIINT